MITQKFLLIGSFFAAPGGGISDDGAENGPIQTHMCIFGAPDDSIETLKAYALVFTRLMRRYKYLEKMFFEEMKKVFNSLFDFKILIVLECYIFKRFQIDIFVLSIGLE